MKIERLTLLLTVQLLLVQAQDRMGVTISIKEDGKDLMMATREDLGSSLCGQSCKWVFTTDTATDTVWNIVSYKQGDQDCHEIVKAQGSWTGQSITPGTEKWEPPFGDGNLRVITATRVINEEDKCWELVPVGGNQFKIKKKLGPAAGKLIKARPTNFKEPDVPKARRFMELSDDDVDNVWEIKSASL